MKKKATKKIIKNPKKPRTRNTPNVDLVGLHSNQEQMEGGVDKETIISRHSNKNEKL